MSDNASYVKNHARPASPSAPSGSGAVVGLLIKSIVCNAEVFSPPSTALLAPPATLRRVPLAPSALRALARRQAATRVPLWLSQFARAACRFSPRTLNHIPFRRCACLSFCPLCSLARRRTAQTHTISPLRLFTLLSVNQPRATAHSANCQLRSHQALAVLFRVSPQN